ncbi:MAG: glycerol-3-phosphate dehydrogenase [Thermoleophilia bacterium]|nr:glycerol-3-phosphate dehydrogenase [Thermoleophilia bacterium]
MSTAPPSGRLPRWLIVGAGSFGTAMARILGSRPVEVTLAARSAEQVDAMRASNTNERYFPGIAFPEDTRFTTAEEAAGETWDGIILAVPTSAFAETVERFAKQAPVFLCLGKGLDPSGRRLSQVAAEFIEPDRYVTLSGPNIAKEMMADLPTAAVIAGTSRETVLAMQEVLGSINFRVYAATDVIGVELAGASKNVVAIAAGVLEGSGLGDNAIAAMMTRGLGEMARLGLANGAELQTYLGLAGVGDLMVTCRSPHSRNHRAGRLLADGVPIDEVKAQIGQVVEGMRTAPIVRDMARAAGIEMHICEAVALVVEHEVPLAEVVRTMMSRQPGFEFANDREFTL